jgi:hypothetical protein
MQEKQNTSVKREPAKTIKKIITCNNKLRMKKIKIGLLSCFLFFATRAHAQTIRNDSTGWEASSSLMLNAPFITGATTALALVAEQQLYCFDLMAEIKMLYGDRIAEQALFINSVDGYVGFTSATVGGIGARIFIMPEIEDFSFMVYGYQGNAYNYFNRKGKQGQLQHFVSTGNTDIHKYQLTDNLTAAPIDRKNIRKTYCDGSAEAMAYKLPDQPTTWYLYGSRYPEKLHVEKYFGAFGVGLIRTREGVYMLMEIQAGNNSSTITHFEKSRTCFNATGFKREETELQNKQRIALDKERDRIERAALSAQRATTCQTERIALVNYDREALRRQEESLANTTHGNIHQDQVTQTAYANMMDPLATVNKSILEVQLDICKATELLRQGSSVSAQRDLACGTARLARLTAIRPQMMALDTQYANQPGRAFAEKSRLLLEEMRLGCN